MTLEGVSMLLSIAFYLIGIITGWELLGLIGITLIVNYFHYRAKRRMVK